jgi:protein-S-isoprenylcysteine O-methyltransferase Ste14
MTAAIARLRVPLGFVAGLLALWLARPTPPSFRWGMAIAAIGEVIRLWASGHIEKSREVTRSGPYRFVPHPLYLGSAVIGAGVMAAAQSLTVTVLGTVYLGVTLVAAMRTEERSLAEKFGAEYTAYRAGRAGPGGDAINRPFSWARVQANREYRAVLGLLGAATLLFLRSRY